MMYKLIKDPSTNELAPTVRRIADGASIPFDTANTDYQEYLKWVSEGNEPLPAENE